MRANSAVRLLFAVFFVIATGFRASAEEPAQQRGPDAGRLDVSGAFGFDDGSLTSQKEGPNGTKVLHGMQVSLGPNNWLKEFSVYNEGVFEQRTQFFPSGKMFRVQRREHNGDGSDTIYTAEPTKVVAQSVKVAGGTDIGPIKVQDVIAQGLVKADKPWDGKFLVREPIPDGFGLRFRLHEYRGGKFVQSEPFPIEQLKLPKNKPDADEWLWRFPDWPRVPNTPAMK